MQERVKVADKPRVKNSLDMLPSALHTEDDGAGQTGARENSKLDIVAQASRDSSKTTEPADMRDVREPVATGDHDSLADPVSAEPKAAESQNTLVLQEASDDAEHDYIDTPHSHASSTPTMWDSLKTPLLAMVAGVSLLAAGMTYSTLEETRARLTSMSDAKAAAEKALGEARGRLAAAEKAVGDVKTALTATPASAAAAGTAAAGAVAAKPTPAAADAAKASMTK